MSEVAIFAVTAAVAVALAGLPRFLFNRHVGFTFRQILAGNESEPAMRHAAEKAGRHVWHFYFRTYPYLMIGVIFFVLLGLQVFRSS